MDIFMPALLMDKLILDKLLLKDIFLLLPLADFGVEEISRYEFG
jgi:hypothetical protein